MYQLIMEHRETLLAVVFYGALGVVALWESVWELRQSSRPPLLRWLNNIAIWIIGSLLERYLLVVLGFAAALYAQDRNYGLMAMLQLSGFLSILLSILLLDFIFYAIHRLWHALPLLWKIHRVHHSDTDFDVSLALRRHPLELLINAAVIVPLILVLGVPPVAVVLFQALRAAVLFFEHANVRLPQRLDRLLQYVVVTPSMHRVHHSSRREETDSNFSDMFPIWDRLFTTYRPHPIDPEQTMEIGLREFRDPRCLWLDRQLLQPFSSEGSRGETSA